MRFRPNPPTGITPGCKTLLQQWLPWLGLTLAFSVPVSLLAASVMGKTVPIWWLIGAVAMLFVITVLHHFALRRSRREIIDGNYCLCLRCRYPLLNLPPEGTCPECGAAYLHERVRFSWRWTLDQWRK